MIDVFPFADLPVAVFGLGRSGTATAKALMKSGAEVWAWDDGEDARARAREAGIPLVDLYLCNWKELTTLVLSPGVPLHHPAPHPVVTLARAANCEVIGDIELLARSQRDCAYVGVTGTNGKSTTTVLIGHIMKASGQNVEIGGNLGTPALDLYPLGLGGTYVLEMSSFQLELTLSLTFDIAVLLNVSVDHLDRHGDMDGYIRAKKLIFHRQTDPRTAVIGVDDTFCRKIYGELKRVGDQIVVPISGRERVHGGVYVVDGVLYDDTQGREQPIIDLKGVHTLPGEHNWQNAAAAYAATCAAGIAPNVIMACLNSYPGLVHRQELVAIVDGVRYVNDSKATNADAAARALACYDTIYWIAGGHPKEGGIDALAPYFGRIRHAFLIGEAALPFSLTLDGKVGFTISGDLKTAVHQARAQALADKAKGAVVLLSPACASFDQFANFEERGDAFRTLVEALPGERSDPEEVSVAPGASGGGRRGGNAA